MKILIFENQKKIKEFDVVLKNKCPSDPIDEKAKYIIKKNQTKSIVFNKKGRSAA